MVGVVRGRLVGSDFYAMVGVIVSVVAIAVSVYVWTLQRRDSSKLHRMVENIGTGQQEEHHLREEDRRNLDRLMIHEGVEPMRLVSNSITVLYSIKSRTLKGIRIPGLIARIWSIMLDAWTKIRNPTARKRNSDVKELALVGSILFLVLFYIITVTFGVQDKAVLIGGAAALGTIVLAMITYISIVEMRKARSEETRPLIVAFSRRAEPSDMDPQRFNLEVEVRNCGRWPAINIRIESDPEFPDAAFGDWDSKEIVKLVSVLPPGETCIIARLNRLGLSSWWKAGQQQSIRVEYSDPYGESYSDSFNLDFEYLVKAGW